MRMRRPSLRPKPDDAHIHADCMARRFVAELKQRGNNVESAFLIHWPGQDSQVSDDLLTGVRHGSF